MILKEQANIFLVEFGLIVPAVQKCLFWHNLYRHNLHTCKKVNLLILAPMKDFLDAYNVEHPFKN